MIREAKGQEWSNKVKGHNKVICQKDKWHKGQIKQKVKCQNRAKVKGKKKWSKVK